MVIQQLNYNADGTANNVVTDAGTFYVLTKNDAYRGFGGTLLDDTVANSGAEIDADTYSDLYAAILDYVTTN